MISVGSSIERSKRINVRSSVGSSIGSSVWGSIGIKELYKE